MIRHQKLDLEVCTLQVETGGVVRCHPAQIPTVHHHQHHCCATYYQVYIKRNLGTIVFLFNCPFCYQDYFTSDVHMPQRRQNLSNILHRKSADADVRKFSFVNYSFSNSLQWPCAPQFFNNIYQPDSTCISGLE